MGSKILAKDRIRLWNDLLRQTHRGGKVCLSQGVAALGKETWSKIVVGVSEFQNFNHDNDPHGEHDCAMLSIAGHRIIWKIDYYDPTMRYLSEDPADPRKTCRVLTIMLADEY
jgi:hypothetical protein